MIEPQQMDFAGLLFPGRSVLYPGECAERLNVSLQHIIDLIDEGQLGAVNIGGGERKHYRIPVAEWEKFLKRRSSI